MPQTCTDITNDKTKINSHNTSLMYMCTCKTGFSEIGGTCVAASAAGADCKAQCAPPAKCLRTASGDVCSCPGGCLGWKNRLLTQKQCNQRTIKRFMFLKSV